MAGAVARHGSAPRSTPMAVGIIVRAGGTFRMGGRGDPSRNNGAGSRAAHAPDRPWYCDRLRGDGFGNRHRWAGGCLEWTGAFRGGDGRAYSLRSSRSEAWPRAGWG